MGPDDTHTDSPDDEDTVGAPVTPGDGDASDEGSGLRSGMDALRRVAEAALIGVGLAIAVSDDEGPGEAVAEPTVEPVSATIEPIVVRVSLPKSTPAHRWGVEAVGHVAALLESGLADLQGVIAEVDGVPRSPGLVGTLPANGAPWTIELSVDLTDASVAMEALVCDPGHVCTRHSAKGPRTAPNDAVTRLLAQVSERLDRASLSDRAAAARPETHDDYAALVIGRASATALGLREPTPEALRGDHKRDPIARAVFLDPNSSLGWSLAGRTATDPQARVAAFSRAAELRPDSLIRLTDLASSLSDAGFPARAWEEWQHVAERAPGDLRFVLPRAHAALAVGDPRKARAILGELHGRYDDVGVVVESQVAVADATGGASDELLAHWQEVDPTNAEPVRRRIRGKVDAGLREEALALTTELSHRGVGDESRALTLALASELGRWDVAQDAAASLGQDDVASRLQAATGGQDALTRAHLLDTAKAPEARLARAFALHEAGLDDDARVEVGTLLLKDPWWPEALDLQSRLLTAKGDAAGAAAAREKLLHADPLYFEDGR